MHIPLLLLLCDVSAWLRITEVTCIIVVLTCSFCRYGVAFTYYGITLNITGFGLNIYLTQFVFAVIEVPMKTLVYVFIEKIGRRSGEMASLVLTGLCLFINLFVPKGDSFSYLASSSQDNDAINFAVISLTILSNFPPRKVDCSHYCGSLWEGVVRVLIHNHIPLYS